MNPLYILLGIGIFIDILNIYWYSLYSIQLIAEIRDPENVRKRRIPSATPGFSLIIYIQYTILTITFSSAKGKPLFPISTEVAIGLICVVGHIVLHTLFIMFIFPTLQTLSQKVRGKETNEGQ